MRLVAQQDVHRLPKRPDAAAEKQKFLPQFMNLADRVRTAGMRNHPLGIIDPFTEALDDRVIAVDHGIEDGMREVIE